MAMEADQVGGSAPCTTCRGRLPFRTPEQYFAYAKRLQRQGSPRAQLAMRAAALAYATTRASEMGREDLVRSGLEGLRAIALADPPPVVLDRAEIQAKFAEIAHQRAAGVQRDLQTVSTVVDALAGVLLVGSTFIGNRGDQAIYTTVVQVVRWAVGSAAGRTGLPFPTLSTDAVGALVGFCSVWTSVRPVAEGAMIIPLAGIALGNIALASALETVKNMAFGVLDGLCSIPAVRTAAAAVPPPTVTEGATNCTDACPRGQYRLPDPANQGQCLPCAPLSVDRSPRRVWEIVARQRFLNEGIMKTPRPTTPGPAQNLWDYNQRISCSTSCQLQWAETQYQASIGGAPIPELRPIPGSSTPRRFFDARTAPTAACRCRDVYTSADIGVGADTGSDAPRSGSGGGGGIAIAAAALLALKFFL